MQGFRKFNKLRHETEMQRGIDASFSGESKKRRESKERNYSNEYSEMSGPPVRVVFDGIMEVTAEDDLELAGMNGMIELAEMSSGKILREVKEEDSSVEKKGKRHIGSSN